MRSVRLRTKQDCKWKFHFVFLSICHLARAYPGTLYKSEEE